MEPRRGPGRARAEGGVHRRRAVRQPALDPRRQAEHRLGQDGALPHHRPVQPAGPRALVASVASRSRGSRSGPRARSCRSTTSGPLEDVRLELAMNIDDFEPIDLGRCGEPYTVWLVCGKSTALWAHGVTGLGLAGEIRPPNPWERLARASRSAARLEWRWDRFSFAVTDFWGYSTRRPSSSLNFYERRVDPRTGKPLDSLGRAARRRRTRERYHPAQPPALRRRLLGDGRRRRARCCRRSPTPCSSTCSTTRRRSGSSPPNLRDPAIRRPRRRSARSSRAATSATSWRTRSSPDWAADGGTSDCSIRPRIVTA